MLRALRIGVVGLLVASALGCTSVPTELVVVIRSSIPVPFGLDRLEVEVEGETRRALDTGVELSRERGWPVTFGLRPGGRTDGAVTLRLVGSRAGSVRLRREVRTRFVPNERRLLVVELDADCLDAPACEADRTCREGACVPPDVDPSTLPPYTGELPGPRDAGTDAPPVPDVPLPDAADAPGFDAPDAASCEADAGLAGEPAGCTLRRPPARPTCGDGGDDGRTRAFALLDPVLDQPGALWAAYGYDLDGRCTDPLAASPSVECSSGGGLPPPDGTGGIDNTLGSAASTAIIAFYPTYETSVREVVRSGSATPLLRIEGWNGEADDGLVDVTLAFAVDVLPAGTSLPAEGLAFRNGLPPPAWDGTDTAYPSATYFTGPPTTIPLLRDDAAYVSGRTLVVALPDRGPIDLAARALSGGTGVLRIRLTGASLVAQISEDGERIESAVLIGRWARADILAYLDDLGICAGASPVVDMFLAAFNLLVGRSLDLRSSVPSPGPSTPCDALSLALPFSSSAPVAWGAVQSQELVPEDCP